MTISLIALANASGTVKFNKKKKYNKAYYSNIVNHLYSTVSRKFLNGDYDAYIKDFHSSGCFNPKLILLEYRITLHDSIDYDDINSIRERIASYYTDIMHYDACSTSLGDVFNDQVFVENNGKFRVKQLRLTLMVTANNSLFNILMRYPKFREKLFP